MTVQFSEHQQSNIHAFFCCAFNIATLMTLSFLCAVVYILFVVVVAVCVSCWAICGVAFRLFIVSKLCLIPSVWFYFKPSRSQRHRQKKCTPVLTSRILLFVVVLSVRSASTSDGRSTKQLGINSVPSVTSVSVLFGERDKALKVRLANILTRTSP